MTYSKALCCRSRFLRLLKTEFEQINIFCVFFAIFGLLITSSGELNDESKTNE